MPTRKEQVKQYVAQQLFRLEQQRGVSAGRAALAQLRRGIGHVPGELPQLWGAFLSGMPEELQNLSGKPSREEWAIYTVLTLYALHQQGRSDSVNIQGLSLGSAAARLAPNDEEQERIWRRLNLVAQSDDMIELSYRLRQLITLLKAGGVGLDYVMLAADLYEYQFTDSANQVRLRWGQSFFHNHGMN